HPSAARNILTELAMEALLGSAPAIRARALVYSFENQPIEKMLCTAVRARAPRMQLVGYQTAGIPSLLLSFFLGRDEARFAPLPDIITTNGHPARRVLRSAGYESTRIAVGGGFRFEHLSVPPTKRQPQESPTLLLVLLPITKIHAALCVNELASARAAAID